MFVVDDTSLVNRLPRLWVGYAIAILFLLAEVMSITLARDLAGLFVVIAVSGWLYWLYCVYKYHDVLSRIQGYDHAISSGRAVGMHWIPFYNFYWVFKWPREIATFVNWRMQSSRAMNGNVVGLLVLFGFLALRIDGFLGLLLLFSAGTYLSRRIKQACLAPPVPKSLHASAAAGPLGL